PDDEGSLTPTQCAAMLPRLEAITDQQPKDGDPVHERRVDDMRQLVAVVRYCLEKEVELIFC
ncbi:hypothetical protein ACWDWS_29565, partial [Streptomyces sp. NPDC003328]